MKHRMVKIIGLVIMIIIGFAFHTFSYAAVTTIMSEGEFAKYVRNHKDWFWGEMDEGILAKNGKTAYFGEKLTPGGDAACQTNGACLYHLKNHVGNGNNYHSCITNLVDFNGKTGEITIYGGKNIKRTSEEIVTWKNANAVAKILYDAYEKKGSTAKPSSTWGASVSYVVSQSRSKIEDKVHPYFFTDSNRTAYTTEQKEAAEKKYNAATKLKPIGSSSISFQDTNPLISTAKEGNTTYTYIGPLKISGSGTIDDIIVGSYKYSDDKKVRWSTTANKSGLKSGKAITPNTNFYLRVKADLSSTKSIKVTIKTKGGEYYKARMALITYLCGTCTSTFSSQNLGIYSGKKVTVEAKSVSKTIMNTGGLEIIKQDQDTGARLAGVSVKVTGPKQYNQTFTTDANGSIAIYDLPAGTFTITEISNPHYGYTSMVSASATVSSSVVKVVLNNQKQIGNLKIHKIDQDTGAPLGGVTVKVRNSNGQYLRAVSNGVQNKVIGSIVLTNLETVPYPWDATEFVTDGNGIVEIQNLLVGRYTVEESFNPHYGYTQMVFDTVNVTRGTTVTLTLKNPKQTGNLEIHKIDKDSGAPLEGVSFKIKASNGNYIIAESGNTRQSKVIGKILLSNLYYTTNEEEATEFITDKDGIIEIHNLLMDTYQVIEISIGNNMAYEIDDEYITWESNVNSDGKGRIAQVKVNRQASNNTQDATNGNVDTVTVKNRRKYIDLGGYVWQDIEFYTSKKQKQRNALWNEGADDKFDQRLKGIEVILRNDKGVIQITDIKGNTKDAITKTNDKGEYEFQRIVIDDLPTLFVEFSYNGMSYQSVPLHLQVHNGSKAAEGDARRKKFNHAYETITYEGSNQHALDYRTSDYESKLKFGNEENYNYGYEDKNKEDREDRGPVNGVDDIFMIIADTYQAYVKPDGTGGYLNDIASPEDIRKAGMTKIENVNLGIEKREQPNLKLVKDLHSIQVSINHATYVYNYDKVFSKSDTEIYGSPQIKFQEKNGSYTRALYESDVYYEGDDKLRVKATYKIAIHNGSSTLTSIVNKIEDYYTDCYYGDNEHVKVGRQIDDKGNVQEEKSKLNYQWVTSKNEGYYEMEIQGPVEVGKEDQYVYVQLEVKQDQIIHILDQNTLCNMAEVTSYSTKKDGQVYAAVDKYSRPGNVDIKNTKTYEWDTCKAPGLQLVLQEERKLDGIVFEDSVKPEKDVDATTLMSGKVREGSGTLDDTDKTVEGAIVELVVVNDKGEIQYNSDGTMKLATLYQYVKVDETGDILVDEKGNVQLQENFNNQEGRWEWIPARYVTKNDGKYSFAGFIPDHYKIIYTWGGKHYIGEEEKTIRVQDYKGTIYKQKDRQSGINGIDGKEWYKYEKNTRYSDAMDNPVTRKAIDDQSSTINYENKMTIQNNNGTIREYEENGEEKNERTQLMTTMDSLTPTFRVNIEYESNMDTAKEYQLDDKGHIVTQGHYAVKAENYRNYLQNVDFGIVERAKQVLQLDKEISWMKVTLANGTVLMDSEVETKNGKLRLKEEVKHTVCIPESEQANAQIKMEIDSEIIQSAKLEVTYTLKVTNISELDYVSSDYAYYFYGQGYGDDDENKVKLQANKVIDYLDNNLAIDDTNQVGNVVTGTTQTLVTQGLYESVSELLKNTKKVLLIEDFKEKLKPNEIEEQKVILSKLLSNIARDDELVFDNSSEIVEVKKDGGSSLITIPGNYTQNLANSKEYDDDEAATITIVPPTGSDTNINLITNTMIGISLLGVFLLGIVLIKKFILK